MPQVLYKSQTIKEKIKLLFDAPGRLDRRVALVAYIGRDYADYLPSPGGIEVVCNPTGGATSVMAVDGLLKAKALVRFSDKLHMKVYWSEARGCVVTSANLSANALRVRGLKEAGVWMEPNTVNIDELLKEAQPYDVTDSRIKRLRRDEERYNDAMASIGKRETNDGFQYFDWYKLSSAAQTKWKLGAYEDDYGVAEAARKLVKTKFNLDEPDHYHGVSKDSVREGDWLLQFQYDDKKGRVIGLAEWMRVDSVVPIRARERAYHKDYPFQAIQAKPISEYGRPPFPLTPQFRKAFGAAVFKLKEEKSIVPGTLLPSKQLLRCIADQLVVGTG